MPFGEFRSTVGTGREGHQVTVLVNVVQAREARSEYLRLREVCVMTLSAPETTSSLSAALENPRPVMLDPRLTLFS